MIKLKKSKTKAVICGVCLDHSGKKEKELSIDEMERLANTAGIQITDKIMQNRNKIDKTYYAGKGKRKDLPTLHASVNAFTRLWLGVMPASTLVFSDDLEAPEKLLKKLDSAFVLPKAHIDWNF